MTQFRISQLALPFVIVLISFLSYSSQYLFLHLDPAPLNTSQLIKFNLLVACTWICYARACFTNPGRIPKDWQPPGQFTEPQKKAANDEGLEEAHGRQRWCRRCEALKPPRSHHCKTCQRCIPKMDHHCPWTNNCVSYFTFPHFIRFLFYAVASMVYLESLIYTRLAVIWRNRNLSSYYGPSLIQLGHLFVLAMINTVVLLALVILFIRTAWMLGANETTIEGWEIERHRTLCRRARALGGFLDGPNGIRVRIQKQEFPYDIGIWKNIRAGMGGSNNIFGWFWPFSQTPNWGTGLEFEVNGFEDASILWPPPDPDRMHRSPRACKKDDNLLNLGQNFNAEEVKAFQQRQQADYVNRSADAGIQRRKAFHKRYIRREGGLQFTSVANSDDGSSSHSGEEAWTNADGERLGDFGVDEEVEFYDEDDVPLAALLQMKGNHPMQV